jgi:di/tricarboxylate transporter
MADLHIYITLGLLIAVFAGFVWERLSPDVVALGAVAILLAFGILDTSEFLGVFSNSAPITIAMMFIISAALERTGCLHGMGKVISKIAGASYLRAMLVIMFAVMITSAFMNNTPVVIMLTPIVISLAKSINVPASKMLIPLSYAAIFGGSATLVGTSTNILLNGVVTQAELPAIGMFEMTLPALIFAVLGVTYMLFAGRFLLPTRYSLSSILDGKTKRQFFVELLIPGNSKYVGQTLSETNLINDETNVIDVVRNGKSLRTDLENVLLQEWDHVVLEADAGEILSLKENGQIDFKGPSKDLEPISADENVIMEGSISVNSNLVGRLVGNLNLRRKYGVYILAVHRNDENINKNFDRIKLCFGDTLLIEGTAESIARLMDDGDLVNLSEPQERPVRKNHAPIAIFTIVSIMGLAALNIMPIAGLAFIGAAIVMVTRCVDADEAYNAIDWRILFLIFGMLGLSIALQKTGAAALIVNQFVGLVDHLGPVFILAMVYLLTSLLTEMISNNAVAVIMGPMAITLAEQLGLDSRPFLIAVLFAANFSFATPIGYQTNTFVYGAGGYKFTDFFKVGAPLNVMFAMLAMFVIPMFFPFNP